MNSGTQHLQSKSPIEAVVNWLVSAFIAAGTVSWFTPDGNLVVILVPALIVGLTVIELALWRFRRGEAYWHALTLSAALETTDSDRRAFLHLKPSDTLVSRVAKPANQATGKEHFI